MSLEDEMHEAAKELRFEYAARLRDEINELKRELRETAEVGGLVCCFDRLVCRRRGRERFQRPSNLDPR
jgi:hypothetical protein